MFMAFRESHGEEQMEVFANRDEALRWLFSAVSGR